MSRFSKLIEEAARAAITQVDTLDVDLDYLRHPAPNAIEYLTRPDYGNSPQLYSHFGQYQIIRDYFELLCPLCATSDDRDCFTVDEHEVYTTKPQSVLEAQPLLVWSADEDDDVCPRCRSTRQELMDDEQLRGINQLVAIVGQRCLEKSSLIFTSAGLLSLDEMLAAQSLREIDLKIESHQGKAQATLVGAAGKKSTVKISTSMGFEQEAGEEHPVLVVRDDLRRDWVKAKDLKLGDMLLVRAGAGLWGTNTIPIRTARLLGYLIADGTVTGDLWVKLCNGCEDVIEDAVDIIEEDFKGVGYKDRITYQKSRGPEIDGRSDFWDFSRGCQEFRDRLTLYGVGDWNAHTKEVPRAIREAPEDVVAEFLGGYFSGDGWAYMASSGGEHVSPSVGCGSVSKKLSMQVRLLLLNMGIMTSMFEEDSVHYNTRDPNGNKFYRVEVSPSYIEIFYQKIRFTNPWRQAGLEDCLSYARNREYVKELPGVKDSAHWMRDVIETRGLELGAMIDKGGRVRQSPLTKALGEHYRHLICAQTLQGRRSILPRTARIILDKVGHFLSPEINERLSNYADPQWLHVEIVDLKRGEADTADLTVPGAESYIANGIANHNSGKSATLAFMGEYAEHRIITLHLGTKGGLQAYLGDLSSSNYEITYLASNEVQSQDTIYAKYRGQRQNSNYFRRYIPWVKAQQKAQDTPDGMKPWRYEELDKVIEHGNMRLNIVSANSNSHGQRGRTRLIGGIDELDYFKDTDSGFSAKEAYRVSFNSLMTARSRVKARRLLPWLGSLWAITSPRSAEGEAMKRLESGRDVWEMMTLHKATWEFNPYEPKANYESLKQQDPVAHARDFEAKPPMAASPLIHDRMRFTQTAINWDLRPSIEFESYEFVEHGVSYVGLRLKSADFVPVGTGAARVIALDAGKNFDAFAIAVGHAEQDTQGRVVTVYDGVARVVARAGQEVWFRSFVDIIRELSQRQPILRVRYDQWQSTQSIQDIRVTGIDAGQEGVSDAEKVEFMSRAYQGLVHLLPHDENEHPDRANADPTRMSGAGLAVYELVRLERDPKNGRVYNPNKGKVRGIDSDDVANVVIHVDKLVQRIGFTERQYDQSLDAKRKRTQEGIALWERGGGGSLIQPGNRSGGAGAGGPGGGLGGAGGWGNDFVGGVPVTGGSRGGGRGW